MSALVDHRADAAGGEPDPAVDAATDAPAGAAAETAVVDLRKHPRPVAGAVTAEGPAAAEDDLAEAADWSAPEVVQDAPDPSPEWLRVDFGAHLEANYQRLVAQLYTITLDAGEAHDVVQDAYSRAWRRWAELRRGDDPTGWVRRVAVRSTQRSWRRVLGRLGLFRPAPVGHGADERTDALLGALEQLPAAERRAVVLFHMVGMSHGEIATLEQTSLEVVRERLRRAHHVVTEGMADVLPSVLGAALAGSGQHGGRHDEERQF